MILKMVEDGKITAEEGVKLLNALEGADKKATAQSEGGNLSTSVDWEEGNRSRKSYRQTSGASKLTGFIETAIQKIKDLDLDFNFGSFVEIEHIFHHRNMAETVLDVSLENGSVTVLPWDEHDVRVECKAKVYRVKDTQEAKEAFLKDVLFKGDGEQLRLRSKVKSIKLQATIYIPEKEYEAMKLYTFNGHLKGKGIKVSSMEIKAVNGSIELERLHAKKLNGETVNGPVDIRDVHIDTADIKTVNGGITVHGELLDVEVETVNGMIIYQLVDSQEPCYADLSATTGSIDIHLPYSLRIEGKLKTNVGGVSCDLEDMEIVEEKKEFVQKSVTLIANKEKSPRMKLDASTNTGSITVKHK